MKHYYAELDTGYEIDLHKFNSKEARDEFVSKHKSNSNTTSSREARVNHKEQFQYWRENTVSSEEAPDYTLEVTSLGDELIRQAINELHKRLQRPESVTISDPQDTRDFLVLKLAEVEHEVFAVMFLDNRHQLIAYEELFRGTVDGASVYPREVMKEALKHNAAAVIFAHNHPSGVPEPSRADEQITIRLKEALAYVDVRVLDHVIVGGTETVSLAERGLL